MVRMDALHRCPAVLAAALIGAALIGAPAARAQHASPGATGNPPSPSPGNSGASGTAAPSGQSAFDKAPKQIIIFDPCKLSKPPAYCNVK
jgi:hypothetical protein